MMRRVRLLMAATVLVPVLLLCACSERKEQPKDNGPQPRIEKTMKDGIETTTVILPETK